MKMMPFHENIPMGQQVGTLPTKGIFACIGHWTQSGCWFSPVIGQGPSAKGVKSGQPS